jgi:hypothetical protein
MNELDQRIREALAAEDQQLMANFNGELSMFQMITDTFRGRHRWLVVLVFVATLTFLALTILSAVQFFKAEEVREMIMWSGSFVFCALAVLANKIWYWMELNKNSVTREVKRVELQVANLAKWMRELEESKS